MVRIFFTTPRTKTGIEHEKNRLAACRSHRTPPQPPISFPLYVSLDAGYSYIPVNLEWSAPIHTAMVGSGVGLDLRFLGRLAADVYVKGGYYQGFLKDLEGNVVRGGNPFLDAGAGVFFSLSPQLRMGIGSSYR